MKKSLAEAPPLISPDAAPEPASGTPFGLFPREQRSLFGEILDWMLTPLLLLWPLSLALTWLVAQGIASKPYDRALEFNLQALAQIDKQFGKGTIMRLGEGEVVADIQVCSTGSPVSYTHLTLPTNREV